MYIKQHKHLDKTIWQTQDSLKPDVSIALIKNIHSLLEYMRQKYGLNIQPNEISDIFIYGSTTNYCYSDKSDIDVCIVLDFTRLRTQNPFINMQDIFRICYKDWTRDYHAKIFGKRLDISFDDVIFAKRNGRHRVGPMYSILTNSWIHKPIRIPDAQFKQALRESDELYKKFVRKYKNIKRFGGGAEEYENLYKEIGALKNQSYDENPDQPITPIYLAWRQLRYDKIAEKILRDAAEIHSKELSLV